MERKQIPDVNRSSLREQLERVPADLHSVRIEEHNGPVASLSAFLRRPGRSPKHALQLGVRITLDATYVALGMLILEGAKVSKAARVALNQNEVMKRRSDS